MAPTSEATERDAERAAAAEPRRPPVLILVYTWDVLRSILAVFGAIGAFSGRESNGKDLSVPVSVQIFQALADAALAVALFLVGTLLTRRAGWVRRAQVVILVMAIVLNAVTVTVTMVTDASSRDLTTGLVSALFALVDLVVVVAMTSPRIRGWFDEPGAVPTYMGGLIAFWAAASGAFFVLGLRS
ncbi:MAG TPA: hypothetical protein VFO60_11785 [Candidatus Dormibacteraeota bacterium]|nr:hypothetical protein [Candidatus Dormibacteraeota bacterium]